MSPLGPKNSVRRNVFALIVFAPWLLVALIRVLGLDTFWPAIPLVAFTPQTLVTIVVPLAVALLLRARWCAIGIVMAMLVLVVIVAPRAISQDQPVPEGRTLRVFSANLMKGGAEPGPLARQIRESRADLVALQEASVQSIAALRRADLPKSYTAVKSHSSDGTYANYTLAKSPLTSTSEDVGISGVWPVINSRALGVDFQNFHSISPTVPGRSSAWAAGLGSLSGPGEELRIIAGDFNATVDHREFRKLLGRGYRDAALARGQGLAWTWSVGPLTRLTIDHVLVPKSVAVESLAVQELPGSDHRSLTAVLRLPR